MSNPRSAHHTITGYHYQFDKSIIEILRANSRAKITLEGVEDVDVEGRCIQCKYYATQRYVRSRIRKPLVAFLKHYRDTGGKKHYTLYAHFGDPSASRAIDLPELKAILGRELQVVALSDNQLEAFLKGHFRYEAAEDFDTQREAVMSQLESTLHSTRVDCEQYYYHNALHEVMRLSRQPTPAKRTTTRRRFKNIIDNKQRIFSRWLAQFKGQRSYCRHVYEELKSADAWRSTKSRFLFLGGDFLTLLPCADIATFCRTLADWHFEIGQVLKDAVPISVIIERDQNDVSEVQGLLVSMGIRINTGYEALAFQPELFNEPPILNLKTLTGGKTVDKVSKASFRISVISAGTYFRHKSRIQLPDTFVVAGDVAGSRLTPPEGSQVFNVTDIDGLQSLAQILRR